MAMKPAVRLTQVLQEATFGEVALLCEQAGVPRRLGNRGRSGRRLSAAGHVILCVAVGIDPETGATAPARLPRGDTISWWLFGGCVALRRDLLRLDVRSASQVAGVSSATISRAEHGQPLAIESYLRLCRFIAVPAAVFLCFTGNMNCNTLMEKQDAECGDIVSNASPVPPPSPTRTRLEENGS